MSRLTLEVVCLLKSASGAFDRQFLDIFATIDGCREEIEKTVATVSLQYIQDAKQITTEIRDVGLVERKREQREKTLRWLAPMDFEQEHAVFSNRWTPGTSQWILSDPEYLTWRTSTNLTDTPRLLWLAGGVGCGKTFLAHFCAENLVNDNAVVIRYFFNAKQEQGVSRTNLSFIRTILYQLMVDPRIDMSSCLDALNDLRASSGKSEAGSAKSLWNELSRCLGGYSGPSIYLVVDALDEANTNDRIDILDFLSKLVSSSNSVRILITGRPEEDVLDWYNESSLSSALAVLVSTVKFPAAATAHDIELYIDGRIKKSKKLSNPSVAEDVRKTVLARAEGMFLYVRLMLDELEAESTVSGVKRRLEQFPKSLNAYYDTVFARLGHKPDSTRMLARDVLMWITSSHEPLHVNTVLLALRNQGLANIEFGPLQNICDDDFELLDPVKQLRSVCFPLLEITEASIVQVVHCSVTAYITSQGMEPQPINSPIQILTPSQANHCIAITCIHFLCSELVYSKTTTNGQPAETTVQEQPSILDGKSSFVRYATVHWPQHLAESGDDSRILTPKLFKALQLSQIWFREWVISRAQLDLAFKKFFCIDGTDVPSCLELATYFGVTSWATHILEHQQLVVADSLPCQIAAKRGALDILRRFREETECLGTWSLHSDLLVHLAARHGQRSIVRYLVVETGCDINAVDLYGRSALMHACSRAHGGVVAELLQLGADASLVSNSGYNAAEDAAAAGDLQSLKDVLTATDDNAIRSSLFLSSANGHVDIVQFLLSRPSVDPDQKDQNSWTALHWASRNGHYKIVNLLLARNVAVDAGDNFGRTPLNRAVQIGAVDISKALLRAGFSPVSRDQSGLSLTHHAAAGGFVEILGLLLSENIDSNTGDFPRMPFPETTWEHNRSKTAFGPPLHIAAEYGQATAVSYLIDHGAEVDKKGPKGETALHRASMAGQETVVSILLQAHADPRICAEGDFKFPLTLATINDHTSIVSLLSPVSWSDKDRKGSWNSYSPVLSAIRAAAGKNKVRLLEIILAQAPTSFNVQESLRIEVFKEAFTSGHLPVAEMLIDLKFDLSESMQTYYDYPTALGHAVKGGQMAMIKFLLNRKVNPAEFRPGKISKPYSGYHFKFFCEERLTALDRASFQGDLEVLELLAKRQELPPDPENPKLPWPFVIDKTRLMPRLRFFSEVRIGTPDDIRNGIAPSWTVQPTYIPEPQSQLCAAIASNDLHTVEIQILEGSDVNSLDWAFETPLIKATRALNTEIVTRLLEAGADVNFICLDGTTALSLANKARHTTLVSALLRAGASIEGISLTDAFKDFNEGDLDLVKMLLKAGVDPNFSLPDEVAGPPLCQLAENRNLEFVEAALPLLLEAGADVKGAKGPSSSSSFFREYDGATPLHFAADHGNLFLIRKLLELGVALDACDGLGRTPLHRALNSDSSTREAAYSELIRYGAQLDTVGEVRISALHIASGAGNHAMVQELLKPHNELNVNMRDAKDRTPLMWAIMGDWEVSPVRELLGHKWAFSWGHEKKNLDTTIVEFLLKAGANVHTLDDSQRSALHWTAAMGRADIMAILLKRGAKIDSMDSTRQTPLHLAIKAGAVECVRTLLAAGANPNALDYSPAADGRSKQPLRELELTIDNQLAQSPAMHLAIKEPDYLILREMTQILMEAGANIFARNANGETTLHVAVREGNVSAVEELICANSFENNYLRIKDNAGKSARDYAKEMGNEKLIALLTKAEGARRPFGRYSRTTVLL
jgi:ankyrin repeat protein